MFLATNSPDNALVKVVCPTQRAMLKGLHSLHSVVSLLANEQINLFHRYNRPRTGMCHSYAKLPEGTSYFASILIPFNSMVVPFI
jgi:hypothetical protein